MLAEKEPCNNTQSEADDNLLCGCRHRAGRSEFMSVWPPRTPEDCAAPQALSSSIRMVNQLPAAKRCSLIAIQASAQSRRVSNRQLAAGSRRTQAAPMPGVRNSRRSTRSSQTRLASWAIARAAAFVRPCLRFRRYETTGRSRCRKWTRPPGSFPAPWQTRPARLHCRTSGPRRGQGLDRRSG